MPRKIEDKSFLKDFFEPNSKLGKISNALIENPYDLNLMSQFMEEIEKVPDFLDKKGRSLFFACAQEGADLLIARFLNAGADPNSPSFLCEGLSPLFASVRSGHQAICNILADAGADLNFHNAAKENIFHIAAKFGRLEIIRQLAKRHNIKALINEGNYMGQTPLHYATAQQNLEIAEFLVEQGADIGKVDNTGSVIAEELEKLIKNSEKEREIMKEIILLLSGEVVEEPESHQISTRSTFENYEDDQKTQDSQLQVPNSESSKNNKSAEARKLESRVVIKDLWWTKDGDKFEINPLAAKHHDRIAEADIQKSQKVFAAKLKNTGRKR